MASKRESDNSRFIHGIKRMRSSWNSIMSEEKEGEFKQPYTNWLTLGFEPWREDGSNKDTYGKGKVIDSASSGSCVADGPSMYLYGMDEAKDAEKKGDIPSCTEDGSNKEVYGMEESMLIHDIPEDILYIIFCKLPLHILFQFQIICSSWQAIISRSAHFHNLWEQSNMQMWLVMDHYDVTSESSNGFALFDVNRRLRFKKIFSDEWRCNYSKWFLRAGDGGLLLYSCKRNGTLRVINPLTMQSHSLEDARVSRKSRISFYMKRYHEDVAVHLKFDSKEKTYQVIVIIGCLYVLRRKKLLVLIYRSVDRKWEIRDVHLAQRVSGCMALSFFPSIIIQNQKIYCFSKNGADVGTHDLDGDCNSRFVYTLGMQGVMREALGIVMYKGRMIMVCKINPMYFPPYTHALVFYEFDELALQWRCNYEAVLSPHYLPPGVVCVGGDYIWLIMKRENHLSHIISVDIDKGEVNVWPEVYPFMFNVRNCLSMPLSFCPCS